MLRQGILRPLLYCLLAALLCQPVLAAAAVQLPESTEAAGPTLPPQTQPPETAAATVPETAPTETLSPETVPQDTAPSVTVPETVPETLPAETLPETLPVSQPSETVPEETISPPPEEALLPAADTPAVCSIAEAKAMAAGTKNVTIQGIVVYAGDSQAVLQDDSGSIRIVFPDAPALQLGDVLLVTGLRSSGLSVETFSVTGTGTLPAVTATLPEAEEEVRVCIENAVLGTGELRQFGFACPLSAAIPEGLSPGDRVNAFGVILDGCFYADTLTPVSPDTPQPEEEKEWQFYFGQLHAHTGDSDGHGTPAEAFAAAKAAGLDFFAVTDHSNSFDNAEAGAIGLDGTAISAVWAAGKAAAEEATDGSFVGIYGYEMSWPVDSLGNGHISTFHTPGWQAWGQDAFATRERYHEALAAVPGSISQFNHPSPDHGDFGRFKKYDAAWDRVMHLIEVGGENGETFYDAYTKALDAGWHLAPTHSENTHDGPFAATGVRTAVLAKELTEESLYEAMAARRVYATTDEDLKILYTMNGQIMGSILPETDTLTMALTLSDPTDDAAGTLEILTSGGKPVTFLSADGTRTSAYSISGPSAKLRIDLESGSPYYYLRITQPDGDIAVTAPIWVDAFDQLGIRDFTADFPDPDLGQEVTLKLELFNEEMADFLLDSIVISQDGQVIHRVEAPGTVPAQDSVPVTLPYLCETPGQITLTAAVRGTIAGISRSYEGSLILRGQPEEAPLREISQVRKGQLGEAHRVKGYVTAGTANPYNTFPNTLYLQDDTGGIAVLDFTDPGIQVGTPLEVTGILRRVDGNLVLGMTDYTVAEDAYYRYVPRTMTHETAMDYDAHGGELLQIEGKVLSLRKTADGKGISRFTIQDIRGHSATVVIEDGIRSGAYGTNELASQIKKGRTVRAMGLLHIDEFGKTVLRVRNCEEVVYVPPKSDPTNPKTGDWLFLWK